jgi:IclR family transcriptional regulator, pca regulon regulatory protein
MFVLRTVVRYENIMHMLRGDVSRRSPDFVQSLERGLAVIGAFDATHPRLTLADAAKRTGLTRATVRRSLHTLAALGYVTCTDGKWFELTPKVLDLGYTYLSSLQVGDIAQPYMEALSERVDESVSAAVLDGTEIVYVARVPTKRIMRIALGLGSRLPALTTSMGRVLVADLPDDERRALIEADASAPSRPTPGPRRTAAEMLDLLAGVRQAGYALVDQELEEGLRSIAAPLRDRNGRAIAAMNVSTTVSRVTKERLLGQFLPALVETAADISAQLAKR